MPPIRGCVQSCSGTSLDQQGNEIADPASVETGILCCDSLVDDHRRNVGEGRPQSDADLGDVDFFGGGHDVRTNVAASRLIEVGYCVVGEPIRTII